MIQHKTIRREFILLISLLVCSFVITNYVFWIFEYGHGDINHFNDIIWWWVVTSSTVGYGDVIPTTTAGRAAGVFAIIIGIYAYTHVISLILRTVQYNFEKEERGYAEVGAEEHVVICEYTAFADELIQEVKERNLYRDQEIVVVGSLIDRTPYPEYKFVHGEPISPDTLKRANVCEANTIFVFSNNRFSDPDAKTLHVVSRIMEINDHADIIVELNDENSELLNYLPREVTIMKTNELLSSALSHKYVELDRYIENTTVRGE